MKSSILSSPLLVSLAFIATIGFALSGYMTWVSMTGSSVVGCGGDMFDCSHVLSSRWSKVLGIPVGLPAMLVYASIVGIAASIAGKPSSNQRGAWGLVSTLSWIAGLSAVWFVGLQIFVVGHLCLYCLVAHGCSIATWSIVQWSNPHQTARKFKSLSLAVVSVVALIASQVLTEPPQTYRLEEATPPTQIQSETTSGADEEPESVEGTEFESPVLDSPVFDAPVFDSPLSRSSSTYREANEKQANSKVVALQFLSLPIFGWTGILADEATDSHSRSTDSNQPAADPPRLIPVSGGKRKLNVQQWPLWGDPNAKYVIAKMFDYTCSHCRATHHAIQQAAKELDGGLAVVALPTPLHKSCNDGSLTTDPALIGRCEIAKIAVAMWIADRSQFTDYHNWMFEQERTVDEARRKAIELVGSQKFDVAISASTPAAFVAKNVFLYKEAGAGTLPKLVFPQTTVVGEISSGSTLAGLIREKL